MRSLKVNCRKAYKEAQWIATPEALNTLAGKPGSVIICYAPRTHAILVATMALTEGHGKPPPVLLEESPHAGDAPYMATQHISNVQAKLLMRDPSIGSRHFSWALCDSLGARPVEQSTMLPSSSGDCGTSAAQQKAFVQASRSISGARRLVFFKYTSEDFRRWQKPVKKSLTASEDPWHTQLAGETIAGMQEGQTGKHEAHFPLQAPWSGHVDFFP